MRVIFVQKFLPHYRLPFFTKVRELLAEKGIEFIVVYGTPDPVEDSKVKMEYPSWGIHASTRHFFLGGRYLYWENAMQYINKGDFVVVEHAAKLLDNYLIFLSRQFRWIKMGYFGHGRNFQSSTEYKVARFLKNITLKHVDRWFAYTDASKDALLAQEVRQDRITVVNNSLAKSPNSHLGKRTPQVNKFIFIGGIYNLKLIPFLLDSADIVAKTIPNFKLHLVGEGPDKHLVDEASKTRQWLTVHGSLYGIERDEVLADSSAILMPGLVGLIAIDSFQFGRPIITTEKGEHSPEIAYLKDRYNCLVDKEDVTPSSYAQLILQYINDSNLRESLKVGCNESSGLYSVDNMAKNFVRGLLSEQ